MGTCNACKFHTAFVPTIDPPFKNPFEDHSQWREDRHGKRKALWIYGNHNSSLQLEEIQRKNLQSLAVLEVGSASSMEVRNETQDDTHGPAALVALLKSCAAQKDYGTGSKVHADIIKSGLVETNVYIGSTLVNMYAKCGALAKAQEVFDELPVRNTVSWTALISGYAQDGQGEMALKCFERMQHDGLSPDAVTLVCTLKACGNVGAEDKGQEIHAEILKMGLLGKNILIGNALVDMYAKCGAIKTAQRVFNKLPFRDVVSWTALIAGYAQYGHGEALYFFEQMQHEGFSPNAVTFVCILNACGSIRAVSKGQEIHAEIAKEGLLKKNILVGNALVDMYAKCGAISKAKEVFDELPIRDVVSWTALIAGYAQHAFGEAALDSFEWMQREGVVPNEITYICILKACGSIGAIDKGQEIHAQIVRKGLLGKTFMLGPALVDMYAKCGAFMHAQKVFNEISARDTVSYNVLITGYAQHGHGREALMCFEQMKKEGVLPNAVTFVSILKACGSIGAIVKGVEIHNEIVKEAQLDKDILVGNALVDMYAKCGDLVKAQEVFDKLSSRSVISWTALIAGYTQHGHCEEALRCFEQMKCEGLSPNAVTFICILKACGYLGMVSKGKEIHADIIKEGILEKDSLVGPSLVDMYAKCGEFTKAQEVFDKLLNQEVISWNALMRGYAHLGNCQLVFSSFDKMIEQGMIPDVATFSILLSTCCHSGLLDKGQMYFELMTARYGITPTLEHHACMVDLFGRAGNFGKAILIIKAMPYSADLTLWHMVLSASGKWGNVNVGKIAFEHALNLDEKDAAAYICMSNIYAAADITEDAKNIEAMSEQKLWIPSKLIWWTEPCCVDFLLEH